MTGNGDSYDNATSLQILEEFVVNNDELLELEERIGRFNIFDALRVERVEIRHSNFLAWLLDPAESHGQGSLFLKAILMDLLSQTPPDQRPLSPVELDGEELRGVEIRREWRHIDLLIICREPAVVIVIENKIDSSEHGPQLDRYHKIVIDQFSDVDKKLFVYLTVAGDSPSHQAWCSYTYSDIHRVLSRVRRSHKTSIGEDVLVFLDHYLSLIGSRFMDDPKIDELCRAIYRNHRQAIELIIERGSPGPPGRDSFLEWLQRSTDWTVHRHGKNQIIFSPSDWSAIDTPARILPDGKKEPWVVFEAYWDSSKCFFTVCVDRASDQKLRCRVIEYLRDNASEWGMTRGGRSFENYLVRIFRKIQIESWTDSQEVDDEQIFIKMRNRLEELCDKLASIPAAIQKVADNIGAAK